MQSHSRLGLAFLFSFLPVSLSLSQGQDPVILWNKQMIAAVRTETSAPTLSSRNLAILHLAMHDAVNSITQLYLPYRFLEPAPSDASIEAAALAAGHEVMAGLYPSFKPRSDAVFEQRLAAIPATSARSNGITVGRIVAAKLLNLRASDGSSESVPYIPDNAPGSWRRTPPFFRPPLDPHWRAVDLFGLDELERFVPPGPPALDSVSYAEAFDEIVKLGGKKSAARTSEQTQIAIFWSDFSYTSMPPGHWQEIAADVAGKEENTLPEKARLFALLSIAQADAAILCWETKFRYNFWRPVTAIHRANEDGNPLTEADPSWDHLLASPSFPEYTSGHSTFSKASAQILTEFYGRDAISFTVQSDSLPGVTRSFASLAACADEIGKSRIYGGIHFEFSNRDGKETGRRIGEFVAQNRLLPQAELPRMNVDEIVDGRPRMRLHGRPGSRLLLEASTNLTDWSVVVNTNAVLAGAVVAHSAASVSSPHFYRLNEVAAP